MRNWPVTQIETEKRRGAILNHLFKTTGGQLTLDMLKMGCAAQGIPSNIDQVRNAVHWLEENHLAKIDTIGSMMTAKITDAGREFAQGLRRVDGILNPQQD